MDSNTRTRGYKMALTTATVLEPNKIVTFYQLLRIDPTNGNIMQKLPEFGKHKSFGGMWADLDEVKYEQMVEALKQVQWRLIQVEWAL
jgi:hypothetical protein